MPNNVVDALSCQKNAYAKQSKAKQYTASQGKGLQCEAKQRYAKQRNAMQGKAKQCKSRAFCYKRTHPDIRAQPVAVLELQTRARGIRRPPLWGPPGCLLATPYKSSRHEVTSHLGYSLRTRIEPKAENITYLRIPAVGTQ